MAPNDAIRAAAMQAPIRDSGLETAAQVCERWAAQRLVQIKEMRDQGHSHRAELFQHEAAVAGLLAELIRTFKARP